MQNYITELSTVKVLTNLAKDKVEQKQARGFKNGMLSALEECIAECPTVTITHKASSMFLTVPFENLDVTYEIKVIVKSLEFEPNE